MFRVQGLGFRILGLGYIDIGLSIGSESLSHRVPGTLNREP